MKNSKLHCLICLVCLLAVTIVVVAVDYSDVELTSTIITVVPNTGLVLWPGSQAKGNYKTSIALEYSYFSPKQITNSLGTNGQPIYNWKPVEDFLSAAQANGHAGIIRFYYEYPNEKLTSIPTGVPDFVRQYSGYSETSVLYKDGSTDRTVYIVDWSNEEFRNFHLSFIEKFGQQYDNDPRLAFVQVGFGWWSEYHLYNELGTQITLGTNFPSKAFQLTVLEKYQTSFPNTPFSISIDSSDDSYSNFAELPPSINYGLFDDSFMHAKHEKSSGNNGGYNEQCWIDGGAFEESNPRVNRGPSGGEVSYYTSNDQKDFLDEDGMHGYKFVDQARKYHITYLLANDAPTAAKNTPEVMRNGSLMTGYKFSIELIKFDKTAKTIAITVKNIGVASTYHPYYITVQGKNSQSLRSLHPDDTRVVTINDIDFTTLDTTNSSWIQFTSPKVSSSFHIPFAAALVKDPNPSDNTGGGGNNNDDDDDDGSGGNNNDGGNTNANDEFCKVDKDCSIKGYYCDGQYCMKKNNVSYNTIAFAFVAIIITFIF